NAPLKGSLTGSGAISITNGTDILYADAVVRVNGGTKGQVLTSNGTDDSTWTTLSAAALKIAHVSGGGTLDFANDFTLINAVGFTGIVNFILPTPTDPVLIGKVYNIKRTDADSNAIVKIVAASGIIDVNDTEMTLGEASTVQLMLESVAPVRWLLVYKF
ncbi:hypothetical protein OIU83_12820, partial [Flavobacterium sp. LS1R49]